LAISTASLIRWAGLPALAAGIIFAAIQPIHPPDVLASVTTDIWAIITPLKAVMCLLFLLGITGIYARQAGASGWLGLAGYLLLGLSWSLNFAFIFAEAFLFPSLAASAPDYVTAVLGIINGQPVAAFDIGALPTLYAVTGVSYLLGGLLFGIATFRARTLPRVASAVTPLAALLPHALQRYAGIPAGLALAWLGLALLLERRRTSQ
jgi:hypothetical protein